MFCRKCGKAILDDSNFCQHCGNEVKKVIEIPIENTIILSAEEAKNGATKSIEIIGAEKSPLTIVIPKNAHDGQVLCLRKVKMADNQIKKRKDVLVKIKVKQ